MPSSLVDCELSALLRVDGSFDMLVLMYLNTRRHIPEDGHRLEDLGNSSE